MVKILIVDDEEPAREVLKNYLADMPGIAIVGEAEGGAQALRLVAALRPDLVLLDVQMPGLDGIGTAASLPPDTLVIFVTAYDSYAIQAFELHAFDYILKPVMKDRLESAVARVQERFESTSDSTDRAPGDLGALLEYFKAKQSYATRLTIRSAFEYLVINTEDLSSIKVENGLVFVYSKGIKYVFDTSLRKLEQRLDPAMFLRLHRNAMVNKNKVKKVYPWKKGQYVVETDEGEKLFISRDHLARFKLDMGWDV
ncbi:MAG TPA: LytTR family DNA-binding domain-containing protein [bacterium]|nr:LytTR family DNA-binding domain-containing protein [bacterium]